jgi:hypothetical protein
MQSQRSQRDKDRKEFNKEILLTSDYSVGEASATDEHGWEKSLLLIRVHPCNPWFNSLIVFFFAIFASLRSLRTCFVFVLFLLILTQGCARLEHFGTSVRNTKEKFFPPDPRKAVKRMEDPYFADERFIGINRLVRQKYGKREPYTTRYRQIAQNDPDWLVRATAIRALNISRDKQSTPVFISSLSDPNPRIRLEAAKALANIPDPMSIGPLVKAVSSDQEDKDVRIAAVQALKHYKTTEVARTLINTLQLKDFGISWQARRSLITMTNQDFRYDEAQWLDYLNKKPLG